ncbi:hypothetical protein L1987_86259 [Smallanthus sonchifolius]|uniref:Uncharacterized protein n=1 Tax=Smallanthus sonchifolius TaxID=185202 RepID=A0ACB8XYT9_9ASTR|nr:hypothetical protein L1987_86259 [Smallanthus sonchifolius]
MRGIIDRYNRDTESSTSQMQMQDEMDAMLFEEMERSNCKVEQLKRFIPSISDAHSKHERASQLDTACHYECGNTPPETALQLRLTCGDHSRQKGVSPRIRHDSSSFGNDKI